MSIAFHPVAIVADLAPDSVLRVDAGGVEVALFNLGGSFYAINDVCTHGEASLSEGYIEGEEVECAHHAGRFDIKTGKATGFPCVVDVESYPVKVESEMILVGIES